MGELVTLDEIRAARERMAGVINRTPVEGSRAVSGAIGTRALLKCEHLQRTGSFKLRGAYNRIARLSPPERARGVVCASAGNHAQGVALSAALLGVEAAVFMPAAAALPKVEATRGYGATVELAGLTYDDAHEAALEYARRRGAVFVHPFDHRDIIAGQGTLGLELLEQVPDAGSVLVPIGGGGLIAGIAAAVKQLRPEARVIGVQAAGAAPFPASLEAGEPRAVASVDTFADGIAVKTPGTLTLAHVHAYVDEVVTVTDEVIARAVLLLLERAKQVVEPSGAAGLAAALEGSCTLAEPVVIPLCGGNVDPLLLARIIQSGLFEEGRYLAVRTRLRDRPGALSGLLALLAERGANIVAVEHHRLGTRLGVLEVEVAIEIETRGPDHITEVLACLRDGGYPVEL